MGAPVSLSIFISTKHSMGILFFLLKEGFFPICNRFDILFSDSIIIKRRQVRVLFGKTCVYRTIACSSDGH